MTEATVAQDVQRVAMQLTVETAREVDGRWIAEVPEIPGVLTYGRTRAEASLRAKILAREVLSMRLEHACICSGPSGSSNSCWARPSESKR